eukprot:4118514-Amphidinium_carterae.1
MGPVAMCNHGRNAGLYPHSKTTRTNLIWHKTGKSKGRAIRMLFASRKAGQALGPLSHELATWELLGKLKYKTRAFAKGAAKGSRHQCTLLRVHRSRDVTLHDFTFCGMDQP